MSNEPERMTANVNEHPKNSRTQALKNSRSREIKKNNSFVANFASAILEFSSA